MSNKQFFCVDARKFVKNADFQLYRPASINNPKSNSVMFITEDNISQSHVFSTIDECLIFWPLGSDIPEKIKLKHAIISCKNPHLEYCRFFIDNQITHLQQPENFKVVNGAIISKAAIIGKNTKIFPCTYIGGEVIIGDNGYIGTGVKIVGEANIGNNVIIRENTVIGADGLTTDRDENGKAMTMPQFGGVVIEDDVEIGANSVIARGAIDNTIIHKGSKIDNCVFISHNVRIGSDTFVVGESIMFGSASTGERVLISGNTTIGNYVHIGDDTILGQNSSVIKSIPDGKIAYGNPARAIRDRTY